MSVTTISPADWRRIQSLASEALDRELEGEALRAVLTERCADAPALARSVEDLLVAARSSGDLLAAPDERAAAPRWASGSRIGPYRITGVLGSGGTGTVYSAERFDGTFTKEVAIKAIHRPPASPLRFRFLRERHLLARLEHPRIARLYDAGTTRETTGEGTDYLVMERVAGRHLDRHLARSGAGLEERLRLFVEICRAVQFAHANLVLHRDLKPSNILVTADGEPKLVDFGIGASIDPGRDASTSTELGVRPLTPLYASPEQLEARRSLTTACDVYGLGVVLYESLCGHPPFHALRDSPLLLLRAVTTERPEPPSRVAARGGGPVATIPRDLDAIVAKALRKRPQDRYGSADELAADVVRHLEGRPVAARRGTWRYRAGKLLERHRRLVGAVLVATLVVAGFAWSLHAERRRAGLEREKALEVAAFLGEVLGSGSPAVALGRGLTVEQALDRAAASVAVELRERPGLRRELELVIGRTYRELGALDKARRHLEIALDLARPPTGGPSETRAAALHELGKLAVAQGRLDDASRELERALTLRRRLFGARDPATVESMLELAVVHRQSSRFEQAEQLTRRAWTSARASLGERHRLTARSQMDLGILVSMRGDLESGRRHVEAALEVQREILPPLHPDLERTFQSLAIVAGKAGDMERAEHYFRRALEILEATLPEDHLTLALARSNLAMLLHRTGRYEQAESLYLQTLEARTTRLEPGSIRLFESFVGLASLYTAMGRLDDAEARYADALATARASAAAGGAEAEALRREILVELELAELRRAAGHGQEARDGWLLVVERAEGVTTDDRSVDIDAALATALLRLGRGTAARPALERALSSGFELPRLRRLAEGLEPVEAASGPAP